MANTSKNNKVGSSRKRKETNKASSISENQRKKMKTIKPESIDGIGMSKQLMMKKAAQKRKRKPKPVCTSSRVLPNGVIMPSITDLEKAYEDSSNGSSTPLEQGLPPELPNLPETCTLVEPIDLDILFSPNTRRSIVLQEKKALIKTIHQTFPADEVLQSPSPRKEEMVDKGVYNSPPLRIRPHKICATNSDGTLKCGTEIQTYQDNLEPNSSSINLKENERPKHVDGNLSDTSLDSNKTIEYNLSSSTLNDSKKRVFSPLPSTSKDDKTFTKNDELFFESLKLNNNKTDNEDENDIQIMESEMDTIIIDDGAMEGPPINVDTETDEDVKIIDSVNHNYSKKHNYVEDDDDCILIDACENKTKELLKEPEIIDLEYSFIDNDSEFNTYNIDNIEDEVIDVDEIIALNQTILNKYKKPDTEKFNVSNLVVDVDMPTFIESRTTVEISPNQNSNQQVVNPVTEDTNSANIEVRSHSECDVVNCTNNSTEHTRNRTDKQQHHENVECELLDISHANGTSSGRPTDPSFNRHLFTQTDLTNFFTSFCQPYQPPVVNMVTNSLLNLFNIVPDLTGGVPDVVRVGHQTTMPIPNMQQTTQGGINQNQHSNPKLNTPKKKKNPERKSNTKRPALSPEPTGPGMLSDCPICMDKMSGKEIASTICGHVFCMSCLEQAIKTNKRCPTCRKMIKKNGYHKIFL